MQNSLDQECGTMVEHILTYVVSQIPSRHWKKKSKIKYEYSVKEKPAACMYTLSLSQLPVHHWALLE